MSRWQFLSLCCSNACEFNPPARFKDFESVSNQLWDSQPHLIRSRISWTDEWDDPLTPLFWSGSLPGVRLVHDDYELLTVACDDIRLSKSLMRKVIRSKRSDRSDFGEYLLYSVLIHALNMNQLHKSKLLIAATCHGFSLDTDELR